VDSPNTGRANCIWRTEVTCLFRQKLRLLKIAREHRAAGNAAPLSQRAMHERMWETTTDEALSCAVAQGGSCAFSAVPKYDPSLCELSVNGVVILRLHKRRNQHAVLCALEDQAWAARIEWPFAGDSENQHRDTVYALNRGQIPPLIDFSCDGSGEGLRWELIR